MQMNIKWNVMLMDLKVIKSKNVEQNKYLHCKPKKNFKIKTRNTGRNAAIWKNKKH